MVAIEIVYREIVYRGGTLQISSVMRLSLDARSFHWMIDVCLHLEML